MRRSLARLEEELKNIQAVLSQLDGLDRRHEAETREWRTIALWPR